MKILRKIVVIMISLFLGLLVLYNGYRLFCIYVLKQNVVTLGGYTILNVVSGSMEPVLYIDDLILINTKDKQYKVGDIVTYTDEEGSFVTHRIISLDNDKMVTKGDNNNIEDKPTTTDRIIGKYISRVANGQKILDAIQSPVVAVLILVNGVLLCIFTSIDRHGNLILDEDEKEYREFKEYLKEKSR